MERWRRGAGVAIAGFGHRGNFQAKALLIAENLCLRSDAQAIFFDELKEFFLQPLNGYRLIFSDSRVD